MDQARIALTEMGDEGAKPEESLQKASYYFAQANLVFFYLIPETPEQELEVEQMKAACRVGQTNVYIQQRKYEPALKEIA